MQKKWNWGDWAVIEIPPLMIKTVSCYACKHYCSEDGSCLKTAIIPRIDGKDCWKRCDFFALSQEYKNNSSFIRTVDEVKGRGFSMTESRVAISNTEHNENNNSQKQREADSCVEFPVVEGFPIFLRKNGRMRFEVKAAREFRKQLDLYYGARHYTSTNEKVISRNLEIIKQTTDAVPDDLMKALISGDILVFSEKMSKWLMENGVEEATEEKCFLLCVGIQSKALCQVYDWKNGNITGDADILLKNCFLDSFTQLLFELGIIFDSKYKKIVRIIEGR